MQKVKLKTVVEIIAGQSPPSSAYNKTGGGLPFFQGRADFGSKFPTVRNWTRQITKLAEPRDILMSVRAPVGSVNINVTQACIGRGLCALRPKKNIIGEYLYFYLKFSEKKIEKLGVGSTFTAITVKQVGEIEIPLPPIAEQIKIAEVLSKTESLIEKRAQTIGLLDELLKSKFLEMFGDIETEKMPLSKYCHVNPRKSEINDIDRSLSVSFIPMANVSETGDIDLTQSRNLENVWKGFTYFKENDVLFAKITPCMENGKGAIVKGVKNGIGFGSTEFHVLRPIHNISTPEWLYHLTMQSSFRKEAEMNMTGSAGQKRVPADFFDKYKVSIPPINLQNEFTAIVEKAEVLKIQFRQSLQELEKLFASLSHKAFQGELHIDYVIMKMILLKELDILELKWSELIQNPSSLDKDESLKKLQQKIVSRTHAYSLLEDSYGQDNTSVFIEYDTKILDKEKELPKEALPVPKTWEDISFQMFANWLKHDFNDNHFSAEILLTYLKDEKGILPFYHSSEEIKMQPQLDKADDLKSFLFSALSNAGESNQFLKLEQVFINAKDADQEALLKLRQEDFEVYKAKSKEERSGIYFRIIHEN